MLYLFAFSFAPLSLPHSTHPCTYTSPPWWKLIFPLRPSPRRLPLLSVSPCPAPWGQEAHLVLLHRGPSTMFFLLMLTESLSALGIPGWKRYSPAHRDLVPTGNNRQRGTLPTTVCWALKHSAVGKANFPSTTPEVVSPSFFSLKRSLWTSAWGGPSCEAPQPLPAVGWVLLDWGGASLWRSLGEWPQRLDHSIFFPYANIVMWVYPPDSFLGENSPAATSLGNPCLHPSKETIIPQ